MASANGISEADFLAFLDELNIVNRAFLGFQYVNNAGSAVALAGHLYPTRITRLVGKLVVLGGKASSWVSIEGPLSRKRQYLKRSNEELFALRGLKVTIVHSKGLRKLFGLRPDAPHVAPLLGSCTMPPYRSLLPALDQLSEFPIVR